MISWRVRRQLIVFFILAIPVVYFGYSTVLKFLPEPTCQDNRKNQSELAVDCGGPCAPCEIRNPKPIALFWARIVPVRENVYDVAAEIQNTNEVLSTKQVDYEFVIFDGNATIATKQGSTFLYPQERVHIVEANIKTTRQPNRVEFKILNVDWEFRQQEKPNLLVEKRDYKVEEDNDSKRSVVEIAILNRTPFGFKRVEVRVIVLGKDENLLGAQKVVIENLLGNGRQEFRVLWPTELQGDVSSIIVEPRVNIFDPALILKP